ncbi:toprim domain-containing protein [Chitinibacter sp. GC72]|uniref:toprim domain-containing protein n=1 Tax=Chitinibacter sp. GC72 TaxID=1526917 RepID=UPI0012F926D3|nr:toprim domain-containing protein [Chitinibacter sp. GC72]
MTKKNATPKSSTQKTQFDFKSCADRVKAAVQGCWPVALQRLGVPAKLLDGRNHPCPACGGTDRFQFTVRGAGAEYGRFACRGLDEQGGDGFKLVMHVFNLSFPDAVRAVAKALDMTIEGCSEIPRYQLPEPKAAPATAIDRTERLSALFNSGHALSEANNAGQYLSARGISSTVWESAGELRHIDSLPYWHSVNSEAVQLGTYPAMIARITRPDGSIAGIHRTYLSGSQKLDLRLDGDENPLPAKKIQIVRDGALGGSAVRLFPLDSSGRLGVAEGTETALASHEMTLIPVWACLSTGGLRSFVVPDGVHEIIIFGDNDTPDRQGRNAGKEAAKALARRLISEGFKVKMMLPSVAGTDWLDVLNDRRAAR